MREIDIRNLTPHVLNIVCDDGFVAEVETSGTIARCDTSEEAVETVLFRGHPLTIKKSLFGDANGVPAPEADIINVASMVVAKAVSREDVTSPGTLIRENGQPVGCQGLSLPN